MSTTEISRASNTTTLNAGKRLDLAALRDTYTTMRQMRGLSALKFNCAATGVKVAIFASGKIVLMNARDDAAIVRTERILLAMLMLAQGVERFRVVKDTTYYTGNVGFHIECRSYTVRHSDDGRVRMAFFPIGNFVATVTRDVVPATSGEGVRL